MGQITLPPRGPVYVDTSAVIYYVEAVEPYRTASLPLWDALDAGAMEIVTSELALLEVLVKPLRDGNPALATLYRNILLGTAGFTSLPVSRRVLEVAADLRAAVNLKTPDAIHGATALEAHCSLFVTNDPAFQRVPTLNVGVLSEIASS